MPERKPKQPTQVAKDRCIYLFYEYNAAPFPTYAEMGQKYGMSRQRVHQLVKRGEVYANEVNNGGR